MNGNNNNKQGLLQNQQSSLQQYQQYLPMQMQYIPYPQPVIMMPQPYMNPQLQNQIQAQQQFMPNPFFPYQQQLPFNYAQNYYQKNSQFDINNNDIFQKSFYKDKKNWKKDDPFKNKTADQIVNEFKAYTLPKLRLKRLIKLQALMRGYHTRKFKIPKRKQQYKILENYVEKFIKYTLEDKIIPDIVLEIITNNKYNEDVSLYSTDYRAHLEIMDSIIQKFLREQCKQIVNESTDSLITNILKKKELDKPAEGKDPFALAAGDIIANIIRNECRDLAQHCTNELAEDYLEEIQIRQIIKERFITKAIQEVVINSIEELIVEQIVNDKCEKLIKELANPLANHIYEQVQQEVEMVELDKGLQNYVLRGMLDIFLEQICVNIDEQKKQGKDEEYKQLQASQHQNIIQ